ncbi:hypothetical protein ACTXT7_009429 [Hymenolepis weldensis]
MVSRTITQFPTAQLEDFSGGINVSLLHSSLNLDGLNEELVDTVKRRPLVSLEEETMRLPSILESRNCADPAQSLARSLLRVLEKA